MYRKLQEYGIDVLYYREKDTLYRVSTDGKLETVPEGKLEEMLMQSCTTCVVGIQMPNGSIGKILPRHLQ